MKKPIYHNSNKENDNIQSNNNHIYNSFVKEKAFNSNPSTEATVKCKSILDSGPTEYGKVLSYGKSIKSRGSTKNQSAYNTPKILNPFSRGEEKNEEISHEYIPPELRNDENYKTILCKKLLKHPRFKTNKTFSKQDFVSLDEKESLNHDYTYLTKRRKISCVKILYSGRFELKTPDNKRSCFNFYRDEDIGINEEWQEFIIETNLDEDVETDEEMLVKLNEVVYDDLLQGIQDLKNPNNSPEMLLRNYRGI